ncbi:anthranilate synthase component I [Sphingorhabdus lutea]|uniref:Anthranilate synthase component 1 n=1 Tax=Sphingorhabdus lutea TaxID=1913578 RepID=A0A1L3JBU7_9SPHN|nr:chorismate-binding protein [Sphingorhabdus lutea]APG62615.1 anthranilate synthase component I [Sphingorhabdus lutea]
MPHQEKSSQQHEAANIALQKLKQGKSSLLWRKWVADCDTAISVSLRLMEENRGDYLLESVEGGTTRGRYSIIGLAPDLMLRAQGKQSFLNRKWADDQNAFEPLNIGMDHAIRNLVKECHIDDIPSILPDALACLVGYFGYETIGLVEKLPRNANEGLGLPDGIFVRPTIIIILDKLSDEIFVIAPIWADKEMLPEAAIEQKNLILDEVERKLSSGIKSDAENKYYGQKIAMPEALSPILDAGAYSQKVLRAKEYIEAGDIFQLVLAQRFTVPFTLPPIDLYRALRRINPSPFLYFLDLPGFSLIGSSPEILVRARDGEVTIRPIAGTRPRGKNEIEDAKNRADLLADPKERAEHLMLLDLGRNDVGRVSKGGSVTVTDSYMVENYSHVMHIVSNVVGELDAGKDAMDALFAGFPAGTVSGAPKVRACQIISELEDECRGPYAGGVGYFSPNGNMDSCIILRTAIVKDGVMHVQSGAGIVADSDPEYEQRECEAKAGALLAAAQEAIRQANKIGFGQ